MSLRPLFPKRITSHTSILDKKSGKVLLSTAFMAIFVDESQKCLTRQKWVSEDLVRPCDLGEHYYSQREQSLYWKDWSDSPTLGRWETDYPR